VEGVSNDETDLYSFTGGTVTGRRVVILLKRPVHMQNWPFEKLN